MAFSPTRLQSYLILLVSVLVLGTLAIMVVEGLSVFDAFYFVVVTIATVGYGDISPSGMYGKAVTLLIIVAGVGTFIAVFADMVETLLSREERQERRKKINMIVGIFFSEFGTGMLRTLAKYDTCREDIQKELLVSAAWSESDFEHLKARVHRHQFCVAPDFVDLPGLKQELVKQKGFLLTLLENPVIFEHDSFTKTLQAFFHLTEELMHRKDPANLPPADVAHLVHDINRGYRLLVIEWVTYMEHLKMHYPYLFSLALRTNPFDPAPQVEFREEFSFEMGTAAV